jgi:deoxycytidine triphosphate deaminase
VTQDPPEGPCGKRNCVLSPHDYWRADEDGAERPRAFWVDPAPGEVGLLSARSIRFYQEQVAPMIEPFTPAQLGAATYELRVGPHWLHENDEKIATRDKPWIEIPPNSLVYVSMCERLRLPLYIAARFDLHISFIYRGLLLGTGPQVDPGFCGVLSCPLHNITNDTVKLEVGVPFVKMEFLKTSAIVREPDRDDFEQLETFPAVRDWVRNRAPHDVPLIDDSKLWRKPIYGYVGDRRPTSSVKSLDERVEGVETTVGRFRVGGAIGLLSFVGLLITLMQLNNAVVKDKVEPLAKQTAVDAQALKVEDASKKAESSDAQAKALAAQVERLERRIERLER